MLGVSTKAKPPGPQPAADALHRAQRIEEVLDQREQDDRVVARTVVRGLLDVEARHAHARIAERPPQRREPDVGELRGGVGLAAEPRGEQAARKMPLPAPTSST